MTIQIKSELSKVACKQKLLNHMDARFGAIWYSIGPIVGTIKGDDVVIQKRTAFFKNSFGRLFYGRIICENQKTILEGQFRLFTPVKCLMGVIIAVYLVMLSFLIYGLLVSTAQTEGLIWGFIGLFGMSLFAGVIYAFGRYKSRAEEAYLVEFLKAILANEG
ncbi:MAG TPA: hypothetical protein VLS94_10885 [Fusibacter sp.]|nr:hypothetical protein [Fusibacter sp.]